MSQQIHCSNGAFFLFVSRPICAIALCITTVHHVTQKMQVHIRERKYVCNLTLTVGSCVVSKFCATRKLHQNIYASNDAGDALTRKKRKTRLPGNFGRREAEKLVTHRENNGSDNFFCIGGVGSVNMHQLDQSPSAHPRVYLTLDERIEPKVRKFKNN